MYDHARGTRKMVVKARLKKENLPEVCIRLTKNSQERTKALAFIRRMARIWHRCVPPPPPDTLIIAMHGTKIVGTISLDFGIPEGVFRLEEIYAFSRATTPFIFFPGRIIQCGRWMASRPHVSILLMYYAACHALSLGKWYALCEAKAPIQKRLRELGIRVHEIPGARLLRSCIPPRQRPYYDALPQPKLFMMQFSQIKKILKRKISANVHKRVFDNLGP